MAGPADSQAFGLRLDVRQVNTLLLVLSGSWRTRHGLPETSEVEATLSRHAGLHRVSFETSHLGDWDSALVSFLMRLEALTAERDLELDVSNLPRGARRLLKLALAVPEARGTQTRAEPKSLAPRLGIRTLAALQAFDEVTGFIGEVTLMFGRFLAGRANYRRSDFVLMLQESGARALPIVTLISLLVGLILAFVSAIQLEPFGAGIYVADLVGIAMAREMAPIMTGIVMAGRTGAAIAAQIGAMQSNEEIDALTTLGLSPIDFLVLPRMLALILMMPLLCIYADVMGILGGWIVGVGTLNLTSTAYWTETRLAVDLSDFAIGLVKSVVFGAIVAIAGCLRGLQSGRNAAAVGDAATAAVVTGIVGIIVADAVFAVVTNALGI